jgi:hypothetical protein
MSTASLPACLPACLLACLPPYLVQLLHGVWPEILLACLTDAFTH